MPNVTDVAKYLIHLAYTAGEPDPITTLKLQKLLYYAQGIHLAVHGKPFFPDKIKAWTDGPVVPAIWHEYKQYRVIPCADGVVDLSPSERVFLRQIWKLYGKYSGDELSHLTHDEPPWQNARGTLPPNAPGEAEVSTGSLLEYFRNQKITLPFVPAPIEIRHGREVYRIEDAGKILPLGI
jgi:uncharacterized phage-associated protein